jgi:NitT/TauT family transport system ATP-binding protein
VRDVSFTVEPGRFVSLVGPSGCGKSTLLGLIAGLVPLTGGRIEVSGRRVDGAVPPDIGYLFQRDALLPWKTALENVTLPLTLRGIGREEARARGESWLTRVGLGGFAGYYPHQLSGGMRKRVSLATTLIYGPTVLLMDEPFSALDVQTRNLMENELLELWADTRNTVLFVTHDLEEAIALADEVVVLSAGPASRVVARHPVTLPRPRNLFELRTEAAFADLYRALWSVLRGEVARSQRG